MRLHSVLPVALICACLTACKSDSAPGAATGAGPSAPLAPRITQLYAPQPTVPKGDPAKICYGVENAKSVWIAPPMRELSAALARCIEVEPTSTTTYTLTVEGSDGKRVNQDITVSVGAALTKILNVNVTSVDVQRGQPVTVCYKVQNALAVTIEPPGFHGSGSSSCVTHQPLKTTTYTVTATGAEGSRDQEQVTVKVR